MNFEYSDEQFALQASVRRVLEETCPLSAVRRILDGDEPYDRSLWRQLGKLGWIGAAIPEEYGGQGLDWVSFCAFIEEAGRAVAPIPLDSSIYLAAQAILHAGTQAQKRKWLPELASGEAIGCFALNEDPGELSADQIGTTHTGGQLIGVKAAVSDGIAANVAVVAARDSASTTIDLYLVDLSGPGVTRTALSSFDPTRPLARLQFDGAPAERLDASGRGWMAIQQLLDRAAILTGFEQLGGAGRCLDLSCDYAQLRHAFARPIGSFQAIKHKLVDVYTANQIARSAAYFGAWALDAAPEEVSKAAAVARIACTQAYERASRDFIHVSGGLGNTWQWDAHIFYRRSRRLAVTLGSIDVWRERLAMIIKDDFISAQTGAMATA